MNPYNFSLLCFGFCTILLAILVFLKRNDQIGKQFLIFSFFCAGWSLAIGVNFSDSASDSLALFTSRLGNAFALFIPVSWYQFILTFVGKQAAFERRIKFLYFFTFAISLFSFTPWFIPEVRWIVGFRCCKPGPIFLGSLLLFFSIVPLGFIELFKKIKASSGQESRQMIGLAIATGIGFLGGGLTYFPVYNIPLPQYGLFITPIYAFALAYFMIKRGLFDAEELAHAAHRDKLTAIGVLAASINHEVKNPLFVIKGLAENWLERKKEGVFTDKDQALEKAAEMSQRSMDQADRAMDIIKRLSLFAKAGIEGEMKFEAVSIAEVLEDILPLVRYELAANNIALTREIPKDLPTVQADHRYLEEILFNLIVNACQALKEKPGGGEIRITAAKGDSPSEGFSATQRWTDASFGAKGTVPLQNRVLVTVADNGPGIPEEKIKDVFRPFYTTKAEGTGLGLYITQQLVEKIRGRIDVQSLPGQGTVFTVKLPR
jgi:signal transduction histidine kinase